MQALNIAKEVDSRATEGHAYGNLDNGYYSLSDYQQALEYYKQALNIAKEVGEQTGKLIAYGNLANDYHILGDYRQAFAYHKQALKSVTGPEKEKPIAISALFITSSATTNKH